MAFHQAKEPIIEQSRLEEFGQKLLAALMAV